MTRSIIFVLLSLVITTTIATIEEKCPFRDTVDLSNSTLFGNGVYIYENYAIAKRNVRPYSYRLEFLNDKKSVAEHPRACVCGPQYSGRYCIKLCCERGKFYNESSASCNEIPRYQNVPIKMKIIKTGDQQHEVMVNIYRKFIPQIGLPCENPQVIMDTTDRWNILENGTLYLDDHDVLLDTVSYCLSPQWDSTINENIFLPLSCPMETELDTATTLNTYGMLLSVVFIIPTIFVYLMLKELRENIKNKIFICYLICMAVSYLIISLLNISRAVFHIFSCSLIGFIGYYFIMATFVWISALCFEIWYNFNAASTDFCPKRSAIRFKIYSLYAWGLTGIMTAVLIWSQLSEYVDEMYKPGIGVKVCWLDTRKWSAAIYFYGPSTIIMIFSTITFIYVSRKIYEIRFDALAKLHKQHFLQENLLILIRLFFIMGISWIMDIISFAMRDHQNFHFIFDLTDFCNATQGVLIFILFVMRPEVMGPLKKKFRNNSKEAYTQDSVQFHSTLSKSTKIHPGPI